MNRNSQRIARPAKARRQGSSIRQQRLSSLQIEKY